MFLLLKLFLFGCNNAQNGNNFFVSEDDHQQSVAKYILSDKETKLLKNGDIILRQGDGFVSNLILTSLNENIPLSHIGIITNRDNEYEVIHTVSSTLSDADGMQVQSLNSFVRESIPGSVVIVRYIEADYDPARQNEIAEFAYNYLEQKVPFDHSFDYSDSTRFFCSELIWRVYKKVFDRDVIPINGNNNSVLDKYRFNHFFDSEYFITIINHQEKNQ